MSPGSCLCITPTPPPLASHPCKLLWCAEWLSQEFSQSAAYTKSDSTLTPCLRSWFNNIFLYHKFLKSKGKFKAWFFKFRALLSGSKSSHPPERMAPGTSVEGPPHPCFQASPPHFHPIKYCQRGQSDTSSFAQCNCTRFYLYREKIQWVGGMAVILPLQGRFRGGKGWGVLLSVGGVLCLLGNEGSHEKGGDSRLEMALTR